MCHTALYEFFRDQGSMIGGVLALIAGVVAYVGARQAAANQIGAMARKDRLQARAIIVGVFPELLALQVEHDMASRVVNEQFPSVRGQLTSGIVDVIRSAQIRIPPLLGRNVDNLYVVQPGAASLLQIVSFTLQYNDLVETLAQQIAQDANRFDPQRHQQALSGHLTAIAMALGDAIREISPIHDEATNQPNIEG